MGKLTAGINGPFRGKTGSVIGSSWRKIHYIKGLPRKVKRKPTPKQALQQAKFTRLNEFLMLLPDVLEIGFAGYTGRATGRNAAFSYNYNHAFTDEEEKLTLNYSALQFSRGSLVTAGEERARFTGEALCVSWDPDTYGMGGSPDDRAFLVLYKSTIETVMDIYEATRSDGGIQHTEPGFAKFVGTLHLWLFFADKAGKQASPTVYIPLEEQTT